ncbi:MAG: hypothetical protein RIQ56_905 [Candidatus Parcubacteria bacterium]|jgi:hypothetical protein
MSDKGYYFPVQRGVWAVSLRLRDGSQFDVIQDTPIEESIARRLLEEIFVEDMEKSLDRFFPRYPGYKFRTISLDFLNEWHSHKESERKHLAPYAPTTSDVGV